MLDIRDDSFPDPKCYFTHVHLPQHVDPKQPPTKKKPFSSILDHPFNHTIDILAPSTTAQTLQSKLSPLTSALHYAKLHLKLLDLISGDFFHSHIKTGNVVLLSAGPEGVSNTFSLSAGTLRLNLDRPTYERAGLQGTPAPSPGRKHAKYRYLVELNLRLPSFARGRPLFNRAAHAFRLALPDSYAVLFADLDDPALSRCELAGFSPVLRPLDVSCVERARSVVPVFPAAAGEEMPDPQVLEEWLEYLSVAMLGCPATVAGRVVDPVISRYRVPELCDGPEGEAQVRDLARLRLRGFVPAQTAADVLARCVGVVAAAKEVDAPWVAVRVQRFDGSACVVFLRDGRAWVWEYE